MSYVAAADRYTNGMQYRRTGRSGLDLPVLSLGFWHNFGDDKPFETQRAIVRRAFDLGITHFDLANNYGPPYGSAEINFGRLVREDLRPYRDEIVVSTKAGWGGGGLSGWAPIASCAMSYSKSSARSRSVSPSRIMRNLPHPYEYVSCPSCRLSALVTSDCFRRAPWDGHPYRRRSFAVTREDPTAKVLRVADQMAPRYDKDIRFWEKVQFGGGREWVGVRMRGRVLEVAVGTGRNFDFYPPGVTATGIELSPAMLTIAKRHAADLGVDTDLHQGDAQALPFGDGSFDTVASTLSLCTIPDPATAIAEMKRVLRPGGQLLLLDHIGSTWWPILVVQRLLERYTIRSAGEHLTRRQLPLVRAAGFEIIETQRLKAGTVERVAARKPSTT